MVSSFFQYIDNLPKELIFIIYHYMPAVAMIFLNKEYYKKYHYLFKDCIHRKQLENYVRTTIRQDNDFVFNQILYENYNKWLNFKKYLYKDSIYANYIYFLKIYCLENQSTKCIHIINKLFEELGLSKNQHKKNIIRNIIWKH